MEWTAWLALCLYPFGLAGASPRVAPEPSRKASLLFLLGGVSFLTHAVLAFVVHYDLSHAVAFEETARQTEELTGFASGSGLYLNYLFVVVWWAEILWWQSFPKKYRSRPSWITVVVHGFFLFMIVNGAVIFVPWPRRAVGLGVLVLCAFALWFRVRGSGQQRAAGAEPS